MEKKSEKIKVVMRNRVGQSVVPNNAMEDRMVLAGWDGSPGHGKAVLTDDGREVHNPVPHAVPIGFKEGPDLVDQIMQKLAARQRILAEDAISETLQDVDDFDVGDDYHPSSPYEVTMEEVYPDISRVADKGMSSNVVIKGDRVPDVKPEKPNKVSKKPPPDDGGEAEA